MPCKSRPSSPTSRSSTTRCCRTPRAPSRPQFGVKRGLLGKLIPVKRTTFVIDTDRKVLDVIASEFSMDTHADKALADAASPVVGVIGCAAWSLRDDRQKHVSGKQHQMHLAL